MTPTLENISTAQRARLAHLEMTLRFVGSINRNTLSEEMDVSGGSATRDIGMYRALKPDNMVYDVSSREYFITDRFSPLFVVDAARAIAWLTHRKGQGDGIISTTVGVPFSAPEPLSKPSIQVIAPLSRAIHGKNPVSIEYESLRESSVRTICPYALIHNGLRWHVRAFDRKAQEFRDFVLTRIRSVAVLLSDKILSSESSLLDEAWTNKITLELVPHPDRDRPEVTRLDYAMAEDALKVTLKWAEVGYALRQWNVDCSAEHSLSGSEFRLWLRNHKVLDGVPNALLAPGYSQSASRLDIILTDQ